MKFFFQYKSGRIHYTDQGSGHIIVLVHGYLETSEVWKNFASKLSRQYRIITIDLPGHGRSDIQGETQPMELMAEAIKELLGSLNIEKVFLTGHSLGGYITLAFAELYPEMLSGYCLFHSHPLADTIEALEKREREITLIKAGKKDLMYPENIAKMYAAVNLNKFKDALKRSKEIASSISGEGIIAVLRGMMARPSRLAVMEEGKVPCLWILGKMDNYVNCELAKSKVRLPKNAELVVLENSGHLGFIEEEEQSLYILAEFVNKCK
ncbi:MAG: alpha/beta hydrolase [Bacteroidia bacterium]|nr:alpha/beta hydrolase [Bacteroidia bacterium]